MAQYSGTAVVPLDLIKRDYFSNISNDKFQRRVLAGRIKLPAIRMKTSRKTALGVHLADLAEFIDKARELALKECQRLCSER